MVRPGPAAVIVKVVASPTQTVEFTGFNVMVAFGLTV
jgi:hypothetical protein